MKIEIRLRIEAGDGGPCDEELLVLDKPHDRLEQVGLSLAEARELLARVQERVVGAQAAAFVADHRHCDACGRRLWSKGRTWPERPERAYMDILKRGPTLVLGVAPRGR